MRPSTVLLSAAALALLPAPADAQGREAERARARVFARAAVAEDRPVIGVSTSSSGERDTLGLLVVSVTPGGPADQAGIEEGNRIAAVNGTNLRLAPADAGEHDMQGMTTRRLVRELGKVEPGQEVELRVWQNGAYRNVKVKTVAAEELPGRRRVSRDSAESRGVIGVQLGGNGSPRDTLGVFVVGVTSGSPAEKAGIVEGDRIAAVGDVSLRVPAADAGDPWMAQTRVNRFLRELRDLRPGQSVALRVYSGGNVRAVNVTAVAARELADEHGAVFYFGDHAGGFGMGPAIAPMPPMPPMAPRIEMGPMRLRSPAAVRVPRPWGPIVMELDGSADVVTPEALGALEALDALEALRSLDVIEAAEPEEAARAEATARRLREELEAREREVREREARVRAAERGVVRSASWSWDGEAAPVATWAIETAPASESTLTLPGLTLSLVNRELASYFGEGAERGLLVLAADRRWDGLREGDVILAVDGRETSGFSCARTLVKGNRSIVVLREGRRVTMRVNGSA